jgi:FkbM family methyltransferase
MSVMFPEPVSVQIHRFGFYEDGLTRAFLDLLRPGMTVFDVGAHFGYFSLLACALTGPSGAVHAFEPTPSTFRILKENLSANPTATPHQCAVYSSETTLSFSDFGTEYSAYNSAFEPRLAHDVSARLKPTPVEVRTTTIDAFVSRLGVHPSFVKIDAESAEMHVLRGMADTLQRDRPVMSMEVGDYVGDQSRIASSRELVEFVRGNGYDAFTWDADGRTAHTPQSRYEYANVIFIPSEHPSHTVR